jgi:hypothetical protein
LDFVLTGVLHEHYKVRTAHAARGKIYECEEDMLIAIDLIFQYLLLSFYLIARETGKKTDG